jgi:hypothetical protein
MVTFICIIQRLTPTPLSLVLHKEYIDCPQRDSHAVHYIYLRGEGREESVLLYSVVLQPSCSASTLCEDSVKIPEVWTSIYILYLSGYNSLLIYTLALPVYICSVLRCS